MTFRDNYGPANPFATRREKMFAQLAERAEMAASLKLYFPRSQLCKAFV
jgi:hypothetical protein